MLDSFCCEQFALAINYDDEDVPIRTRIKPETQISILGGLGSFSDVKKPTSFIVTIDGSAKAFWSTSEGEPCLETF